LNLWRGFLVEHLQDLPGSFGLDLEPAADGCMTRRLARWQDDSEQIRGLTFAQPQGGGRRGKLALLGPIQGGLSLRTRLQFGDPPLQPLVLSLLFLESSLVLGRLSQSLFHLAGMFIDRFTAAL
jgi:hypothetical protein